MDASFAVAYSNRGQVYNTLRQFRQGLADCTKAIQIDPELARAYYFRGEAYQELGDRERSIADMTSAIRLNPDFSHAFRYRAYVYLNVGKYDLAIADSDSAIRLEFAKDYVSYENRAKAYVGNERFTEAASDYTVALWFGGKKDDVYSLRGQTYWMAGNYASAANDFVQQFNQKPEGWVLIHWYLASMRAGAPRDQTNQDLAAAARTLRPNWPIEAIRLFLGQGTVDAVLRRPSDNGARCEAQFYLGAWHLLRSEPLAATERFKQAAADKCSSVVPEYAWAKLELKRLQP